MFEPWGWSVPAQEGGKSDMVHLPSERRPAGKKAKKVAVQKLLKEGGRTS